MWNQPPPKPTPPKKTIIECTDEEITTLYDDDGYVRIGDLKLPPGIDHKDLLVELYDPLDNGEFRGRIFLRDEKEVPNKNYEKQLKKYEKDLAKWESEVKSLEEKKKSKLEDELKRAEKLLKKHGRLK